MQWLARVRRALVNGQICSLAHLRRGDMRCRRRGRLHTMYCLLKWGDSCGSEWWPDASKDLTPVFDVGLRYRGTAVVDARSSQSSGIWVGVICGTLRRRCMLGHCFLSVAAGQRWAWVARCMAPGEYFS